MSVRIRLSRVGATGQPTYRVVATDRRSPRDGRSLEILGHYNPRTEPSTIVVDEERIKYWIGVGAQPSDTVLPTGLTSPRPVTTTRLLLITSCA